MSLSEGSYALAIAEVSSIDASMATMISEGVNLCQNALDGPPDKPHGVVGPGYGAD